MKKRLFLTIFILLTACQITASKDPCNTEGTYPEAIGEEWQEFSFNRPWCWQVTQNEQGIFEMKNKANEEEWIVIRYFETDSGEANDLDFIRDYSLNEKTFRHYQRIVGPREPGALQDLYVTHFFGEEEIEIGFTKYPRSEGSIDQHTTDLVLQSFQLSDS